MAPLAISASFFDAPMRNVSVFFFCFSGSAAVPAAPWQRMALPGNEESFGRRPF